MQVDGSLKHERNDIGEGVILTLSSWLVPVSSAGDWFCAVESTSDSSGKGDSCSMAAAASLSLPACLLFELSGVTDSIGSTGHSSNSNCRPFCAVEVGSLLVVLAAKMSRCF